jgi:hydrogenase-4 membrane subunit HyfE
MYILRRKLLIGILVVPGIAVTVVNPLISGICAVVVWVYLVRIAWKQQNTASNDQIEQEMTNRHLKRVKALLIVAGISFLVFIVGSIAHNALHGLSEINVTVTFFVALVALLVFIAATAGGMVIFLKARKEKTFKASIDTKCLML